MPGFLQPLDSKFAIVDTEGRPTQYFTRWAQQKQIDITDSITLTDLANYLAAHKLIPGTGIQLTPDGNIADGVTIHADAQAILDEITATRGAIIYRGLLGWSALLPGTAGYVLSTNGAGNDPTWVAQSGGGGGGSTPTIRSHSSGNYNGSSVVVPLPAGTAVGDVVIVYWENGYSINATPTGWTVLYDPNLSNYTNQACIGKVMTSADITAGSVTVTAGGPYNGVWFAVCLTGSTVKTLSKVPDHYDSPGSGSISTAPVTGMLAVASTNLMIGFACTRGAMNMTVSSNLTIVETQNSPNASGIFFTIAPAALGKLGMSEAVNCPVGNNGCAWTTLAFAGP